MDVLLEGQLEDGTIVWFTTVSILIVMDVLLEEPRKRIR